MEDKSVEKYAKYQALENKLMTMIAKTGNEELMNTFLDWQKSRIELNEENFGKLEDMLNDPNGVLE